MDRWIAAGKPEDAKRAMTADEFRRQIQIPSTRAYVDSIVKRYADYRALEERVKAVASTGTE